MPFIKRNFFGRHYRMERFSVLFLTLTCALVVTVFACLGVSYTKDRNLLGTTVLYTDSTSTSKTGTNVTVDGVYVNDAKDRAFVIWHYPDSKNMSTNADAYTAFMTGAKISQNKKKIDGAMSANIYTFGSSGYMAVYLSKPGGFDNQVLSLTIRSDNDLKATNVDSESVTEKYNGDSSFADYDQFQIFFNPYPSQNVLPELNTQTPSTAQMFRETVIAAKEKEIHEKLDDSLEKIKYDLANIDEYTRRAQNAGIAIQEMPDGIAGDSIEEIKDEDGNFVRYEYHPATILDGGLNLDWQNRSVTDGFLADLIAQSDDPNRNVDQYLAWLNTEKKAALDPTRNLEPASYWSLADGTPVDAFYNSGSGRFDELVSIINDLQSAWRTYYKDKSEYQRDLQPKLLDLEVQASIATNAADINTKEKNLILY